MNSTFFKFLLKNKKSLIVVVAVVYLLAVVSAFSLNNEYNELYALMIVGASIVSLLLAYILVPIIYSFVHNKKAVDSYFSLPITRKQILTTSLVFVNAVIIVPYLLIAIASFILANLSSTTFNALAYLLLVLVVILGSVGIVLFNSAIFLETNNTFDGIVMIIAYTLMPFFIWMVIQSFFTCFVAGLGQNYSTNIISYLSLPTSIVSNMIIRLSELEYVEEVAGISLSFIVCIILYLVISIISYKKNFIDRKVERAGNISNSFFSYPFIIYGYTLLVISIFSQTVWKEIGLESIALYIVVFICFMVASFVYQRKIKMKVKDVIFFVAVVVLSIVLSNVAERTKGFGLSNHYDHNPKNIAYRIDGYIINEESYLDELIEKAYPDFEYYEIHYEAYIPNSKMDETKALREFMEQKRQEGINEFYNRSDFTVDHVVICTNYNELDPSIDNNSIFGLNNYCRYSIPRLDYKDLLTLNEYDDVIVIVYLKEEMKNVTITLNDLINLANNQK